MIETISFDANYFEIQKRLKLYNKVGFVKILHSCVAAWSSMDSCVFKEIRSIPPGECLSLVSGKNVLASSCSVRTNFMGESVSQVTFSKNGLFIWTEGDKSLFKAPCNCDVRKHYHNDEIYKKLVSSYLSNGWSLMDISETSSDGTIKESFFVYDETSSVID